MAGTTQDSETFRWRTWSRTECSKGATPIGHLFTSFGPNETVSTAQLDSLISSQVVSLRDWTEKCPHTSWHLGTLRKLDEGSEHSVYLNPTGTHVLKLTFPNRFGEFYYIAEGRMNERRCTPLEYLTRIRLVGKFFGFSSLALGITDTNRMVSIQRFVSGDSATQDEVDSFLSESSFSPVRQNCWLWNTEDSVGNHTFKIWIGDARCDNFVKTPQGLIPINLRMWITPG